MKKILLSVAMLCMALCGRATAEDVCGGWPADYPGVMLQGFWWDSYDETTWVKLTEAAPELSQYFDLIWVPNSGTVTSDPNAATQGSSMGYDPCFWLSHNSCFGTEAELRSMINTYKQKGVGIIEDVVINHKKGRTSWLDFPDEEVTVGGKTYKIDWKGHPEDYITCNDDCNSQGYATHGGYDTGDDFPGFRDLDHTSSVTRDNIKVYLDFLLNELGYAGFRYDLVKGYSAGYIQTYNNSAMPQFSVGEYWDNQTNIQNWIMGTGNTSAAFDFPLKYKLNEAISGGDYSAFDWKSFSFDPNFSRYAVTFADNHDSGREDHSRLVNNWSAANAFLLASPGTPCIWYPHYKADPTNIGAMILARKACGITNTGCDVQLQYATDNNRGYVMKSVGTKGSVYVLLGEAVNSQSAPEGYKLVAQGDAYKFYSTEAGFGYVTVSPNGGPFTAETIEVTLTPVQASTAWYKVGENGNPIDFTVETKVQIGDGVALNGDVTVYWGATGTDGVEHTGSKTFTRRESYPAPTVEGGEVSVFFETDAREVYFYAWGGDLENDEQWNWDNRPEMTLMGVNNDGKLVYKWTYDGTLEEMPTGLLFIPDGKQTPDMDFVNHGYYTASGLSYYLGTSTVYFDNSGSNWANVYYYAWDSKSHNAEWPGVEVTTKDERGYYQVSVEGYTSIIFNDPNAEGVKQTEDLTVVDGKVYKLGAKTVYYDNSDTNWANVYYYAYTKDEVPKAKWPGEKIATPNSDGLFEVSLLDAYTTVIFNDGVGGVKRVNQTDDLSVKDKQTYTLTANTVYFDNTIGWEHVYYYAFTSDDKSAMTWPGEEIATLNSDGYYEVSLVEGYTKVIFDDGTQSGGSVGVNQTEDLTITDGEVYMIEVSPEPEGSATVYFDPTGTNWTNVYYYTWGDGGDAHGWPGEQITDCTDGIYKVTVPAQYTKIIFNNGSGGDGNQTANLDIEDGKIYDLYGNTFVTVYFDKPETWNNVHYYVWNGNGDNGWPGKEITAKDYETASGGYYKAVVNSNYPNIVFNNGSGGTGNQTNDLVVTDGKIYRISDATGSTGNDYYPNDNSLFYPSSKKVEGINIVLNENGTYTCALLVLIDGVAFKNDADFTALSVSYVRDLSNGYKWGSIIMPFTVTSTEEVQFYTLKSVTSEKMVFSPVDEVTANTPAIYQLLNEELDYLEIYTDEVDVKPTGIEPISIEPITDWTMCGTYQNVSGLVSEGGNYIYFVAQDSFWLAEDAITVKPFRAWFETTSPLASAKMRIEVEGEPEGIQTIEEERSNHEVIFDLMGRQSDSSRKGIVIKNGTIIFVK